VSHAVLKALEDERNAEAICTVATEKPGNARPFPNIVLAERRYAVSVEMDLQNVGATIPSNSNEVGNRPKPVSPGAIAEAFRTGLNAEIVNMKLYDRAC
jgi:hypothetical protein